MSLRKALPLLLHLLWVRSPSLPAGPLPWSASPQGKKLPANISDDAEAGEVSDEDSADEIDEDYKLLNGDVSGAVCGAAGKMTWQFATPPSCTWPDATGPTCCPLPP